MIVLTGFYPATEGSSFDMDYFLNTHGPLVRELLSPAGLRDLRMLKGLADAAGGDATYRAITELTFDSLDALAAALGEHGPQVMGDIPNFTDAPPALQINEVQ